MQSDITAILARRSLLSRAKSVPSVTMERSRLTQARTLAEWRMDFAEVAEINNKLAELNARAEGGHVSPAVSEAEDKLAKVNERSRKANLEAVCWAELAEAERKRKEHKLAVMQVELSRPLQCRQQRRLYGPWLRKRGHLLIATCSCGIVAAALATSPFRK